MPICVCPTCGNEANVLESSWGQPVQCPHCAVAFLPHRQQTSGTGPPPTGLLLVTCPGCRRHSGVTPAQKGREVRCPHCGKPFSAQPQVRATRLPPSPPVTVSRFPQPPADGEAIRFACPQCDHAMEVPSDQAGAKFPCPSCGQRVQVPLPINKTVFGKRLDFPLIPRPASGLEPLPPPAPPPAPPPPPVQTRQLFALAGPDRGKVFPLPEEGSVQIGRASAAQVRLTDIRVSRDHCRLEVSADEVVLTPSGGQQAAYVNGERVSAERPLLPGDVLRIGESELRYDTPDVSDMKTVYGDLKEAMRELASVGKISVTCTCGQELVARSKYAGTRVRCPACEEFITLPGKAPRGQRPEPPPVPMQDPGEGPANVSAPPMPPVRSNRAVVAAIALFVLAVLAALGTFFWTKGLP